MSGSTENQQQDKPAGAGDDAVARETEAQREPDAAREAEAPGEPQAASKAGAQEPPEPQASRESEAPPARTGSGRGVAVFALLVALAAVAAAVWQWHDARNRFDTLRENLAKKLTDFERQAKEVQDLAREIRQSGGEVRERLGAVENRVAESQSQQIALEQLYQDLSRGRDDFAFAEVEQALLIANQQLQLAGNVRAALIALQSADARLQAMDRPQLTNLRKSLARDIERLKGLPHVDMVGLSARIESLIARVDELPLAPEARPRADAPAAGQAPGSTWERIWREAWAELRQLIRVQRMDKPDLPLLAPEQRYFLRENLKLRLLGARVALLARDEKSFRDDLEAARALLERYFDTGAQGVVQVTASLASLHGTEISVEAPDISATIEAMRSLRLPRERGTR